MILLQHKKCMAVCVISIVILIFNPTWSGASDNTRQSKGWLTSTPEAQGMHSQMLVDMMAQIEKNRLSIDSIIIVRNGHMVFDAYFWPFLKGQKHVIHSCTKSIVSALIGIAIDKGHIKDVNQTVVDLLPAKEFVNMDELKQSIRLENLLMMTSGLKCRDSYLYHSIGLFEMRNSKNWAQHVLSLPMSEPPGEKFEYCNGATYLLSVIIQYAANMRTLDFARKHFFNPLDIMDVESETSPQGVDIGYGEMWLKPDDMAKIGLLYLNNGRWNDQQIVPVSWIKESTRGRIDATLFDQYGYQWWVDSAGYYAAVGYMGQFIFVVPDKNMVVVFCSDLEEHHFSAPKRLLEQYILPAAVSPAPLPANKKSHARLNEMAKNVAKPMRFTWNSEAEGAADGGVFERKASPKFKFEYPLGSKKLATDAPGQVMNMKTPEDVHFSASVGSIPVGLELEEFGPKLYAPSLKNVGEEIEVISNKEITLICGTKAYRTEIKWLWDRYLPIRTILVSAFKDGNFIFVCVHPWKKNNKVEPIVHSLTLK